MRHRLLLPALIIAGCSPATQTGGIEIKPVVGKPTAYITPGPTAKPKPSPTQDLPATGTPSLPPTEQSALDEVARSSGKAIRAIHRLSFQTSKGEISITTFPDEAPQAAAKFLQLVKAGVYDGTTFHRVIPNFVAQGGDPQSKTLPVGDPRIGYGTSGDDVPDAFANGLKHLVGSVALAHDARANSSNCQFYICLAAQPSLDDRYIVFGHVLAGLAVAQALNPTETGGAPDKITKATMVE
ncbi:MAG: peptidyl-prolyl cis-trans isomerase [Cyanobacteria bacterium RYN_339]|nr:peptidyl-prolyl cis-trans isomerase [Cyanobacteria bacterium RYN_339]